MTQTNGIIRQFVSHSSSSITGAVIFALLIFKRDIGTLWLRDHTWAKGNLELVFLLYLCCYLSSQIPIILPIVNPHRR